MRTEDYVHPDRNCSSEEYLERWRRLLRGVVTFDEQREISWDEKRVAKAEESQNGTSEGTQEDPGRICQKGTDVLAITRADYWQGELLTAMQIAGGHNPTATHRLQFEAHSDASVVKQFDHISVEGLRDGWTTEGGTILTFADSSRLAIIDATDAGGMTKTLVVASTKEGKEW